MKIFDLKGNGTNIKTELVAGITTFMTMAYILAINPNLLSAAGMDAGALFTATAIAAIVGTLCMAFMANYPFALAPGMGLNAFFAFTVVIGMGISFEVALTAVLVEGIIFLIMSFFNVRESIFKAIPQNLKYAVGTGIGFFIAFIGFQNANLVVADGATKVSIFSFAKYNASFAGEMYTFNNVGMSIFLALVGLGIISILVVKKVRGAILLGILGTYILGIICELGGLYVPYIPLTEGNPAFYSLIPNFANGLAVPSIKPLLFKFDFSMLLTGEFFAIVFAFLFVDLFDTLGTIMGVSTKANMLDKDGNLPRLKGALMADAIATTVGACIGTSTTTTYVESASGVAEGGRTGLTAVVVAILFAISLFLSPIFLAIPAFATAPALIIVGFYMMGSISKINFTDVEEGIPAFLTIMAMTFTYSISEGIVFGIVSYVIINDLIGNRQQLSYLLRIIALLFVEKYVAGSYFSYTAVITIALAIAIPYYIRRRDEAKEKDETVKEISHTDKMAVNPTVQKDIKEILEQTITDDMLDDKK